MSEMADPERLSSRQALLLAMKMSQEPTTIALQQPQNGIRTDLKTNAASKGTCSSSGSMKHSNGILAAGDECRKQANIKRKRIKYRSGMSMEKLWEYLAQCLNDRQPPRKAFKLSRELRWFHDQQVTVRENRSTGLRTPETALQEFTMIQRNILSAKARKQYYQEWLEDRVPCSCKPEFVDSEGVSHGCSEQSRCVNRGMQIECTKETCSTLQNGGYCENQQLQVPRPNHARYYALRDAGKRGLGLFARKRIRAGSFIVEYVGEVISTAECELRMATDYAGEKHKYLMTLSQGEIVDATRKGGLARFINHCCDPVAGVQMWSVKGEPRIVIFANSDIQKGQEITIDYNFQRLDNKIEKCRCGATNCRRVLGVQRDDAAKISQKVQRKKRLTQGTDPVTLKKVGLNLTPAVVPTVEKLFNKVKASTAPSLEKDIQTARENHIFLARNVVRGVTWFNQGA